MDWQKFSFDYNYNRGSLLSPVLDIEGYKRAVNNLALPPDWREQLNKLNRIRDAHGTTALEGNPLSEEEVSHQLDAIEQPQQGTNKPTKEQLQIRNAGIAQSWVKERFHVGAPPMTLEDILKIHYMTTVESDTRNNTPGKFRTWSVTAGAEDLGGVHKGAPHEDVPKLMEQYIEWVNSKKFKEDHPVIRALLSHFFLVTIHPFGDGNGRVSRLVEAGMLFEEEYNVQGFYGLSNYFYQNERAYKTILQGCRKSQPFDVTEFINFGLEGFASELKGINNFIKTKLNRVVYRNMLIGAYNKRVGSRRRLLNEREYNLLLFLLTETEPVDPFSENPSKKISFSDLFASNYVRGAYRDVTSRTLSREFIRLSKVGFITFKRDDADKDWIIELDFSAIGKYSQA